MAEPSPPGPSNDDATKSALPDTSSTAGAGAPATSAGAEGAASATQLARTLQLLEEVKSKPCSVVSIDKIYPKLRTREHIIDRELEKVAAAQTLEEIHGALVAACNNLESLGMFNRIEALISEEPLEEPDACSVSIDLEEKKFYAAKIGTHVQGTEASVEAEVRLRNLAGYCEQLAGSCSVSASASSAYSMAYRQPRVAGAAANLSLEALQTFRNNQRHSSFTEAFRGIIASLTSTDGQHSIGYELGWRSITDPTQMASRAVLQSTGDYLKSALRYSWFMDRRDDPAAPSEGWALRLTTELSGLGPETQPRFVKQQVAAQWATPLTDLLSLSVTASAGVLLPWGSNAAGGAAGAAGAAAATCIADRFFLGGVSSLRGFKTNGVGPTDARRPRRVEPAPGEPAPPVPPPRRDALGGDAFASVLAAANLAVPHPLCEALGIHAQAFVNGGNAAQLAGTRADLGERVREFGRGWRWSAGLGLVVPTFMGRFEANYAWVLAQQPHDRVKRGLHFGFATSGFL